MKSSLQKNFAIAFYRYRMWLEEQQVPSSERISLLRQSNHFLAYLTFSSSTEDYWSALQKPEVLQKALRAYKRFLRSSMNYDAAAVASAVQTLDHFCQFNTLSVAASRPGKTQRKRASTVPASSPERLSSPVRQLR